MKSDSILQKQLLPISLKLERKNGEKEFFSILDSRTGLVLQYSHPILGFYALRRLEEALAQHDVSILGEYTPKTKLRIYWPKYSLLEDEDFQAIAALGFNALVIEESQFPIMQEAKEWGFTVFYKPTLPDDWGEMTPFDSQYAANLRELFQEKNFDYIFWESPYFLQVPRSKLIQNNILFSDLLQKEILELEQIAPLFFLISDCNFDISRIYKLENSRLAFLKGKTEIYEQILETGAIHSSILVSNPSHFVWKAKSRPKKGEYSELEHYILGKKLIEEEIDPLKRWLSLYQTHSRRILLWFREMSLHYSLMQSGTKKEDLIPRFLKLEKEFEEEKKQQNAPIVIKHFEEALLFLRQM